MSIPKDILRKKRREAVLCVPRSVPCAHMYYQDEKGMSHLGNVERPFCPSDEFRHLLSPETLAELERRGI